MSQPFTSPILQRLPVPESPVRWGMRILAIWPTAVSSLRGLPVAADGKCCSRETTLTVCPDGSPGARSCSMRRLAGGHRVAQSFPDGLDPIDDDSRRKRVGILPHDHQVLSLQ